MNRPRAYVTDIAVDEMKFKQVSWNWGSFIIGYHYGRNPVSHKRFLYIGLGPFLGLDFHWPEDDPTPSSRL